MYSHFFKSVAVVAVFAQLLCGNVSVESTFRQDSPPSHTGTSTQNSDSHSQEDDSQCEIDGKCLRSLSGVSAPQIRDADGVSCDIVPIIFMKAMDVSPFLESCSTSVFRIPFIVQRDLAHRSLVVLRL